MVKRFRQEILCDILRSLVNNNLSLRCLINTSELHNYYYAKEYITRLVDNGLIINNNNNKYISNYTITERGKEYLITADELLTMSN